MTTPTLGTVRQVSQHATDIERAVAFYRDVLELPLTARFRSLAFFRLGDIRLLLEQVDDRDTRGSILYLAVRDVHSARAMLEARGVRFEDDAPHAVFTDDDGLFGPAGEQEWLTFFRDTEENLLALSARAAPG